MAEPATPPYILYGVWSSYYSAKVRSYLRKKGLPFVERVPGSPEFRSEILPVAGTHHIPILKAPDGAVVQDSTLILDYLEAQHPAPPALPHGPRQRLAAVLMELFAQEGLVRPAMHYRWSFPEENGAFLRHDFGRSIKPGAEPAAIEAAGARVAARMNGKLPGLGIDTGSAPAIEQVFHELLLLLDAHFRQYPYLLGGLPCRADHALMAPIFGHLLRDPHPARLVRMHAPAVARWAEQMNVPEPAMPEFPGYAPSFHVGDDVSDTLIAILRHFCSHYGPELIATATAWNEAVEQSPDLIGADVIDPSSPTQPMLQARTFSLAGTPIRFTPRLHPLWMLQRAIAVRTAALEDTAALVAAIGGESVFAIELRGTLVREGPRLVAR